MSQQATENIRDFLQFIALQFIQYPSEAQLRISEPTENNPDHIRFRLILNPSDVAILIGRNGFTASSIRNVLKAAAIQHNVTASLQILSHEEEQQRLKAIEAGQTIHEHHEQEDYDETDSDLEEES